MQYNNSQQTVCIVIPGPLTYSETFLQAHIEHLPARVIVLYGDWQYNPNRRQVLPSWAGLLLHGLRAYGRGTGSLKAVSRTIVQIIETIALQFFLQRHNVDVVLAEYGMMGVHVMNACDRARKPLVVHFHGYDAYSEDTILQKFRTAYRRMFESTSGVIAVSRAMEQQLLTLGALPATLFYNPCGVEPSLFSCVQPAANPPIFVSAGRFVNKKAPHLTLLAFHQVLRTCPEAKLIMIGDGSLWEASKDIVSALGLSESVEFSGALSHQEVAMVMQRARAVVQHSVRTGSGDSEGTPVAILEAGMSGLPVVSTRHAGIKDVVVHGETGFLVEERDVEGMADFMIMLAEDADLAARMGKRARDHAVANFTMQQHIARLMNILEVSVRNYHVELDSTHECLQTTVMSDYPPMPEISAGD